MTDVELPPVDPNDEHEAWLAWRREGIGASDIAAVCGLSPWSSPLSVYLHKTGQLPETEQNTAMRLGKELEPFVADQFHRLTGLHVVGAQRWCVHPVHAWARCTVDGFAAHSPDVDAELMGVVELKTVGDISRYDVVPDYVELQVQWQLYVTGMEHAWVCVFGGGRALDVVVREVERNPSAIARMVERGEAFWQSVVDQVPPRIDAYYPADALDLAAVFDEPDPEATVELDELVEEVDGRPVYLVDLLRRWKDDRGVLDKRITRIENELKARLGNATVGTLDGQPALTWKGQEAHRIDTTALREHEPDVAARYETTSTSRVLRLKTRRESP